MSNVSQDLGHTSQQQQQQHLGLSIHQQQQSQRQPSPHFSADFSVPPPPVASRPGFQTNLSIK
jgi:hypothetical protein